MAVDIFAPIIGGIRPGLFVSSNFLPGSPGLHLSGEPADRERIRRPELPWPAQRSEQAARRILVPDAVPGHRQRLHALPAEHRIAVRRTVDGCSSCSTAPSRKGRLLMKRDRTLLNVGIFTVAMLSGGGDAGGGVRRVPIRLGAARITPRSPTLRDSRPARTCVSPVFRSVGRARSSSTRTTPSTSRSTSTSATSSTRRRVRWSATRTWSATATSKSPPAQANCASSRRAAPSRGRTPSPRSTSTRCSADCGRCSRASTAQKINEVSNAVMELLQGQGGALSNLLSTTGAFTQNLAARDQLIGDVINNLNTVLGHGRRQGRAVQRQRRPTSEADHRPGAGPRSDRRRDSAAGVGRPTT